MRGACATLRGVVHHCACCVHAQSFLMSSSNENERCSTLSSSEKEHFTVYVARAIMPEGAVSHSRRGTCTWFTCSGVDGETLEWVCRGPVPAQLLYPICGLRGARAFAGSGP